MIWTMITRSTFRMTLLLAGIVSMLLRVIIPANPYYGATHDDLLMVKMARSIIDGNWVGSYDELGHIVLSKPAGYPIFLALSSFLPWGPTLTVHMFLLLGVYGTVSVLGKLGVERGPRLFFFVIASFFPPFYGDQFSRIYREGFLTALTFLIIATGLSLISSAMRMSKESTAFDLRTTISTVSRVFILGALVSWFIGTKAGWYVTASLALTSVVVLLTSMVRTRDARRWSVALLVLISFVVGSVSFSSYLVYKNKSVFGIGGLDSYSSGGYPEAINALGAIEAGERRPYVLVSAAQREAAYSVSETMAKMKEYLEAEPGVGWRSISCSNLGICDESAGWFVWELRDAAQLSGLGTTPRSFDRTFRTIAKDIVQACDSGLLRCGLPGLAPGVNPLSKLDIRRTFDAWSIGVSTLLDVRVPNVTRAPSDAVASDELDLWSSVIGDLPRIRSGQTYLPEAESSGSTVRLMEYLVGLFWGPLLLGALLALPLKLRSASDRLFRLVSLVLLIFVVLSTTQIALLESSSGIYMSAGRWLYLLPIYPALLVIAALFLARLSSFVGPEVRSHENT